MSRHSPISGRSWGLLAGLVVVVGLLFVAISMLSGGSRGDGDGEPAPDAGLTASGGGAESGSMPPAPVLPGDRVALAPDDTPAAAPGDVASTAHVGSAKDSWTGPTSIITGTVLDHERRPLSGAAVIGWPSEATRGELGIHDQIGPELDALPRTTTDEEGHFELRAPNIKPADNSFIGFGSVGDYPTLFVDADGYAVRQVECRGLIEGDFDAGTIAVEPGGYLTGRIVDGSGHPVKGARLDARQHDFLPRFVATKDDWQAYEGIGPAVSDISGEDGRFELGGFWPGTAAYWVKAEGHLMAWSELEPIEVGRKRDVGDVLLPDGGTLAGLVVDQAGAPVPAADVFLYRFGADTNPQQPDTLLRALSWLRRQPPAATSGSDGRFSLAGLEPTNYALYVDAAGFEPLRVPDVGPALDQLRVALVRQATLQLTVLDEATKDPIVGASVQAVHRSGEAKLGDEPRLTVHAGLEPGTFVVERLGTWRTDLVVVAPGYATQGVIVRAAVPPETVELTVALAHEDRISGRVLTAQGEPITGATVATVALKDAAVSLPSREATTGADGRYELAGLMQGEWTLSARAQGFIETTRSVMLPAAGTPADIDFQLDAGATVFGTYFDSDDRPSPGHGFELHHPPSDREAAERVEKGEKAGQGDSVHTSTDSRGDFAVANLRAGHWDLGPAPEVSVELAPGQRVRLDLHEPHKAGVRGHVFADGQPKAGALVIALDRSTEEEGYVSPSVSATSDADGSYELKVRAGNWYLLAAGTDPPCGGSAAASLTLSPGDQRVVDLLFGGERLSVVVLEAGTGRPLRGAELMLSRKTKSDPLTPTFSFGKETEFWPRSDADGKLELPYVQPGAYSPLCRLDGYLSPRLPDVVVRGGPPPVLRIELQPEAVLHGTVKLASGVAVKDETRLTLRSVDDPAAATKWGDLWNGDFDFKHLPAGNYVIEVQADRGSGQTAPPPLLQQFVTLKAGESKTVALVVPH